MLDTTLRSATLEYDQYTLKNEFPLAHCRNPNFGPPKDKQGKPKAMPTSEQELNVARISLEFGAKRIKFFCPRKVGDFF